MKITFFSNYFNAHQLPLAQSFNSIPDVDFTFVSLKKTEGSAGRKNLDNLYPFVIKAYQDSDVREDAMRHACKDDVVIFGDVAGHEEFVRARSHAHKLFFRYSERLLKRGDWWRYAPPKIIRTWNCFTRYKEDSLYVLCASAYTARDLAKFGFPPEKCFVWGYFPELLIEPHSRSRIVRSDVVQICSVQRLLKCKRVDIQIVCAARLKKAGRLFKLTIVGDGPERDGLENMARAFDVTDCVVLAGQMDAQDAQRVMANSDLFLATSNRQEGWGATVNEAMAAGCCVVASSEMGSVPYLIDDGRNGVQFNGGADELFVAVDRLFDNKSRLKCLGEAAMADIRQTWNSKVAANRFVHAVRQYLKYGQFNVGLLPSEGPMSPEL